jgi:RecB family exonuclease
MQVAFALVERTASTHRRRTLSSLAAFHATEPFSLLDPSKEPLVYPKSLSPSSITTFQSCPQSFLFQYMLGMSQPTNLALLKGRVTHSALEQLFDLKPSERTLQNAQNLLRKCWSQMRTEEHLELFSQDDDKTEIIWGRECLQLLENYIQIEDPMQLPQPAQRELWVRAVLKSDDNTSENKDRNDSILVRGIVDRLDLVRTSPQSSSSSQSAASFRITDYKTGKAPDLKYSAACNQRIRQEAFFQLQIYAMLLHEMRQAKTNDNDSKDSMESSVLQTLPVTQLRLLYLTSQSGQAIMWDDDIHLVTVDETKQQVLTVWKDIRELVDTQDPKAFVGCQRSFCYCHKCRDKFVPGSVWEPSM